MLAVGTMEKEDIKVGQHVLKQDARIISDTFVFDIISYVYMVIDRNIMIE